MKTTVLYGAEVWGFRYVDEIEKCQSQLLKSIYCLARGTPGYMLRLEMGVVKLSFQVFKQMVEWWLKILAMPESRYPKICYDQLREQDLRSSNIQKFNWVSLLKRKLVQLGYFEVWDEQSYEVLRSVKNDIYRKFYFELITEDWERLELSSYGGMFAELKLRSHSYEPDVSFSSTYLMHNLPIIKLRALAQLRLAGNVIKLYLNGMSYEWDLTELCSNYHNNQNLCSISFYIALCIYLVGLNFFLQCWGLMGILPYY